MLGYCPPIKLDEIQDDLTNTQCGFSFVQHPGNKMADAYLELATRACTYRTYSLFQKGRWDHKAIYLYLKQDEDFRKLLMGILYTACGQVPRITELSSLECENGPSTERGIYVWNGSMVYLTRHHKAKRSTNWEFYVVRFLPAQGGRLLFQYLVYIRPFTEMLRREMRIPEDLKNKTHHLFYSDQAGRPWLSPQFRVILQRATEQAWHQRVNAQCYRQLSIGVTEKHVQEVFQPFNRHDDRTASADRNVVFAWQSGHRPVQRSTTYGLDGAFPSQLQPALLRVYEWASTRWHEFLGLPSKHLPVGSQSFTPPLASSSSRSARGQIERKSPVEIDPEPGSKTVSPALPESPTIMPWSRRCKAPNRSSEPVRANINQSSAPAPLALTESRIIPWSKHYKDPSHLSPSLTDQSSYALPAASEAPVVAGDKRLYSPCQQTDSSMSTPTSKRRRTLPWLQADREGPPKRHLSLASQQVLSPQYAVPAWSLSPQGRASGPTADTALPLKEAVRRRLPRFRCPPEWLAYDVANKLISWGGKHCVYCFREDSTAALYHRLDTCYKQKESEDIRVMLQIRKEVPFQRPRTENTHCDLCRFPKSMCGRVGFNKRPSKHDEASFNWYAIATRMGCTQLQNICEAVTMLLFVEGGLLRRMLMEEMPDMPKHNYGMGGLLPWMGEQVDLRGQVTMDHATVPRIVLVFHFLNQAWQALVFEKEKEERRQQRSSEWPVSWQATRSVVWMVFFGEDLG
jgi:hypothetical protein